MLVLLRARGLHLHADVVQRIESCSDAETLDRWLVRAASARDVAELFEA